MVKYRQSVDNVFKRSYMKLMYLMLVLLVVCLIVGCASHLYISNPRAYGIDSNSPIIADGKAADTLAEQIVTNLQTEAGRIAKLFEYNSIIFSGLFLAMLGGIVFAALTKSSWSWIIPTVAGGGIFALIFITQVVAYIKWVGLGVAVVVLFVLIYKAWQYQSERNVLIAAATTTKEKV
jgi:hypothetical protein